MSALLETLGQVLSSGAVGQISRQIGSDEGTTGNALSAALPVLIGAFSRNASQGNGAEDLFGALSRDHDGGILDNLDVFPKNPESGSGSGILGHMLGQRRSRVESVQPQQIHGARCRLYWKAPCNACSTCYGRTRQITQVQQLKFYRSYRHAEQ